MAAYLLALDADLFAQTIIAEHFNHPGRQKTIVAILLWEQPEQSSTLEGRIPSAV